MYNNAKQLELILNADSSTQALAMPVLNLSSNSLENLEVAEKFIDSHIPALLKK